jgi:hypothetical protein
MNHTESLLLVDTFNTGGRSTSDTPDIQHPLFVLPRPTTTTASSSFSYLMHVLHLLSRISVLDITLTEEIARQGTLTLLKQLLLISIDEINPSPLAMPKMMKEEIHDVISSIISSSVQQHVPFPLATLPYTNEEILSRLPLSISITAMKNHNDNDDDDDDDAFNSIMEETFFIQQVSHQRQAAQHDVGFGMYHVLLTNLSWLYALPGPDQSIGRFFSFLSFRSLVNK